VHASVSCLAIPCENVGLGEYCCWFPAYFIVQLPAWTIMEVKECCSLIGIRDGSIEVLSTSSHPFEFPESFKEKIVVASKQLGPFQPCNLAAK